MGEYFKIINQAKKQYLEPFSMPCSERFPSIISNDLMCRLITRLVCGSENAAYNHLKEVGFYTRKHLGGWYTNAIEIIGDYGDEEFCRTVAVEYQDITSEAIAMLLENDASTLEEWTDKFADVHFRWLAEVDLLEHCPENVRYQRVKHFGPKWKDKYHKERSN